MRSGTTLVETITVLLLVGIVMTIAVPRVTSLRDRVSVRGAALETVAAFGVARRWALSRAVRTAVAVDTGAASLMVRSYGDTVLTRRLAVSHGVALSATRDSMAYSPNGLGYGAANMTLVLRRGSAAETIYVSRLGRVRR